MDTRTRSPYFVLRFYDVPAIARGGASDENTGVRILNPEKIDKEVTVNKIDLVGNYALRIDWSDGHNTGLYSKLRFAGKACLINTLAFSHEL